MHEPGTSVVAPGEGPLVERNRDKSPIGVRFRVKQRGKSMVMRAYEPARFAVQTDYRLF